MELLRHAQLALAGGRPGQALRLTAEHATAFPRSALYQERELIAITALVKLGRRAEAEDRGKRFIAVFPGSIHSRRVRSILGIQQPQLGPPRAPPRAAE